MFRRYCLNKALCGQGAVDMLLLLDILGLWFHTVCITVSNSSVPYSCMWTGLGGTPINAQWGFQPFSLCYSTCDF